MKSKSKVESVKPTMFRGHTISTPLTWIEMKTCECGQRIKLTSLQPEVKCPACGEVVSK